MRDRFRPDAALLPLLPLADRIGFLIQDEIDKLDPPADFPTVSVGQRSENVRLDIARPADDPR